MAKNGLRFPYAPRYNRLEEVLLDHKLAVLGDAYVNFIYSLALSIKTGGPFGKKVKGKILAEALKKSGLRELLPSRIDRHKLADAAEALIIYAWLKGVFSLVESVEILSEAENSVEGFHKLLILAKEKLNL